MEIDHSKEGREEVRPDLTILDQGQRERVHECSLQILSQVGMRVDSEEARQLIAQGRT